MGENEIVQVCVVVVVVVVVVGVSGSGGDNVGFRPGAFISLPGHQYSWLYR